MLKQRVLTALVLLPLLLTAVWYLESIALYALFAAVLLIGAWEWMALAGYRDDFSRAVGVALAAALLAAVALAPEFWPALFVVAAAWWLFALRWLFGYPGNFAARPPSAPFLAALGALAMVPAVAALAWLRARPDGALWVLYLFFLIFCADSGAYFAGRSLGRRKLLPQVSPGKTVEGAVGGLLLALLWALGAGYWMLGVSGLPLVLLMLLAVPVVAASVVGDLTESLLKRQAGVKDSGRLLPGHGGLLDRVDSMLSAAPTLALGLWVLSL